MTENLFIHKRTGNEYTLITIGKQVETKETMAVYRSNNTLDIWVRPLSVFNQNFQAKTPGA